LQFVEIKTSADKCSLMAVESIQKDTGTQANIQLTRYKVMIQSRTSIDRLGLHEVVALVKPDTIECFNFHESQLDLFFLIPHDCICRFLYGGRSFFCIIIIVISSLFYFSFSRNAHSIAFLLFLFLFLLNLYYYRTRGARSVDD
jgi:hypothetical protein